MSQDIPDILVIPDQIHKPGSEPDDPVVIQRHSNLQLVHTVKNILGQELFSRIENSFLNPIITLANREIKFSGQIFHYLMQRRLVTKGKEMWFRINCHPSRFSKREFALTTGIHCEEIVTEKQKKGKNIEKKPYLWMEENKFVLGDLLNKLATQDMPDEEKLCLGAVVLVEGILIAVGPKEKIPHKRLCFASDFDVYCCQPWGEFAYNILYDSITKTGSHSWVNKERYNVKGFVEAIHLWVLIAVPVFGDRFAQKIEGSEKLFPSCLKWQKTRQPRLAEIDTLAKKEEVSSQ